MATVFSITTVATNLRTDAQGHADCSFTVSNTSGRSLRGRAEIRPGNPSQASWYFLAGAAERDFAAGGTDQFAVKIATPSGAPAGKYSFRLDVVSTQNPDEDFAEGPDVSLEVTPTKAPKRFPWWIVVVAAVALIGLSVGLYFGLRTPKASPTATLNVPNVVGMPSDQAQFALAKVGLLPSTPTSKLAESTTTGTVLTQNPAGGTAVPIGTAVQLEAAVAGVKVPEAVGKSIDDAKRMLTAAGLQVVGPFLLEAKNPADDGKVQQLNPPAGTLVSTGSSVEVQESVIIIRGVQAPNLVGLSLQDAKAQLTAVGLTLGGVQSKVAEPGTGSKVLSQDPSPANGTLAQGATVNLVVTVDGVRVPGVVGMTMTSGAAALSNAGLNPHEQGRVLAQGKAQDTILNETPPQGTLVMKGSDVGLQAADAGVTVPNVVGFSLDGANRAIQSAGLLVITKARSSESQAPGVVLDQDLQAGALVKQNSTMTISVNQLVQVPSLTGMNVSVAGGTLAKANLTVGSQSTQLVDTGVNGTILSQNPGSGVWVKPNSQVQVQVASVKPKPVGCDGVAGSGKTLDSCGVCGGANACLTPCPAQTVNLGNDYVFIYLDLPRTNVGETLSWQDVSAYTYHFPRCYRVALSNSLRYSCERTPNGGVWKQYGDVTRDANCWNSGASSQKYMRISQ